MTLEFGETRITGVSGAAESADWPEYRGASFTRGRNFVPSEVADARAVVVLSEQLALDLFGSRDPLGERVRVTGGPRGALPMTVVGVMQPPENLFLEGGAYIAVVPFTTAVRRMGAQESAGDMIVVPRPDVTLDHVEDQIIGLLRGLRGLAPAEPNNFSVVRSTQLLDLFDRLTAVFFMVMLALSSVGLLVGGVGVIGIMMISVTERTREIGIRKAVGATGAEILWQFLVEASVLTIIGGAAGLLLGGGFAWAVSAATPIPARVPAWAVAASLVMAALTGMLFGLIPAARAARMEPVGALRYE
jgi:putative ABC transport system permease protein